VGVAGEAEKGFFESSGRSFLFERCGRIESEKTAVAENGDAIGEELNLGKRM
jgi:hypothetical protein